MPDPVFQVISQQQITQQQIQQAQQAVQQQQQQFISPTPQAPLQHPNLLPGPQEINPSFSQALFNQQQQQQLLQQQQFLQQQIQQIKPPVIPQGQKPAAPRKTKKLLPLSQLDSSYHGLVGNDTVTPPPSTPLTPNPSPASDSMSALIDLDAQTESNHDTALTLACAGGHAELVTYLLSKGADIEHRDKKGFTPLILAATAGHVDVVEILLESSAEIEAQSERTKDTPLSLACSGGRYEVVELLLSRGANKEHRNVSDYTPLSLAASGGFVNIIKLLLSHGAEINSRTGSKLGISPLMLAAMNGHTAAVKLLLDMGSDINAQIETNRNTALTLACFQGRHEVVSLLVDRRANIEHRAKTGLTPLMEAASGGYVEVGRVLLDKGADVNAPPVPSSRDTALTIAADKGHYRFVELLLSRYSLVDVKNKKGNSPLWLACHGGHLDVVQLLVSALADIDSQDNRKVSCLMAAFRKGHIKVVKWMVKHVNQFPSDAELSRYIATVTDKELQKKCQQCMEIIVSAKDRQAAEANKVATSLLEELDKEKQHEENKRLAAQKKRERKKKKKKEKQETKDKEQSDTNSKNSSPEPESEDSQIQEPPKEMVEIKEIKPDLMMIQPPAATTTSTLGLTLPTSDPIYTKSKGRIKKPEKKMSVGEIELNGQILQDENQDPLNNRGDKQSSSVSKVETKKNRRNQREREKNITPEIESSVVETSNISTSVTNKGSNNKTKSQPSNKKKKDKNSQINCSTAIGDLDDFGNIPMISDRDFEKLSKKPEKTKAPPTDKHHTEKAPTEPSNPNMLSVKSTPTVANSPKRGQKKEDGWKEVIRKSKKVQVPASAISRVIGRGGCNINAIREVSGANIEVEKNRGSGDRTITIKGSAEVTRQAHALITALVTDPDKELVEILPKTKNKQQPIENKSLYFIPPNDKPPSNTSNLQSNNNQQKLNKTLAPRLQQQQQQASLSSPSNRPPGSAQIPPNPGMVWGNSPAPGAISPRRNTVKPGAPYTVTSASMNGPMVGDKSGVTRQLFMGERRGFGSPTSATTVARSSLSTVTKTSPASPSFNMRPDVRLQQPVMRNPNPKTLVPGTVKLLQRPNSANPRFDGQPLPIVPNQTASTVTTLTVTSSSGGMNLSSSGEFSPFNNPFSNAAEQLLGKKDDANERMNFASVAAAGVVPPFSGNNVVSPVPHSPDPALQAKAPGFKPMTSGPRMANPQDVIAGFKGPGPGYPMMPQFVDMNTMQASIQAWQGYQGMYQMQGFNAQQNNYSNQSPNLSPRSSQSGSTSLSPRSSNAGFDPQSVGQKEEYTTPNQPMTLPKISSSLNPNAPDFTSRSINTGSGPEDAQNFFQGNQAGQEMTKQLHAVFSSLGPTPGSSQAPGGPLTPDGSVGNQDPLSGMQLEFFASLMQQVALQSQQPGNGGLGQPPGPGFTPPPMVPRAFSPLTVQGRPSSAPSVAGLLPRDGASPTPIGPAPSNSPLPPSTPPMPEIMRMEDRRQLRPIGGELRPIGGERVHKKAPGPPLPNNDVPDFSDSFWNLSPQLNMDWNQKGTSGGMTPATLQTSVISTSVNLGGNMSTDLSSNREIRLDNPGHPRTAIDDLNDSGFPHYTQNSLLTQMPLFNGVGGPYPNTGFSNTGIGSGGDGIQSMWSTPIEQTGTEDGPEPGVDVNLKNKVNEMWNWAK